MSTVELVILAIGLSMDAFAVSICRGLSLKKVTAMDTLEAGVYFGGFQGLMPILGYFLGYRFADAISNFDHWIAFVLLGFIGINMIRSAFGDANCEEENEQESSMLTMAVATSIDALAVGVSLAFLKINIFTAALFIGIVTFLFSGIGIKLGGIFGAKFKSRAELFGGVILLCIGCKILLEHTIFA